MSSARCAVQMSTQKKEGSGEFPDSLPSVYVKHCWKKDSEQIST